MADEHVRPPDQGLAEIDERPGVADITASDPWPSDGRQPSTTVYQ